MVLKKIVAILAPIIHEPRTVLDKVLQIVLQRSFDINRFYLLLGKWQMSRRKKITASTAITINAFWVPER